MPGETPLPADAHNEPTGVDPLDVERLERAKQKFFPPKAQPVSALVGNERRTVASVLNLTEHTEKLKNLKPRLLEISPDAPLESPDLRQLETLYTANLVPDQTIEAFLNGHMLQFKMGLERRGGMLNRFQPTEREMKEYAAGYTSVRDQLALDMLGLSGKPGKYQVMGMFDDEQKLRAYLSFRTPPQQSEGQEKLEEYERYLRAILLMEQMHYRHDWNMPRFERGLGNMWEFDTINVDAEWNGAAPIVVRAALQHMKNEFGKLPGAAYCYYFRGLRFEGNAESMQTHGWDIVGENSRSRRFLGHIGFDEMAVRSNGLNDRIIRELPDGQVMDSASEWGYMYGSPTTLQKNIDAYMRLKGLLGKDEPLLS